MNKQFQLARKNLINARITSYKLREFIHNTHQQFFIDKGTLTEQQSAYQRRNNESQRSCLNLFKTIRQGNRNGGLYHVLVPSQIPSQPHHQVRETSKLEHVLLDRNITHFKQAHGTHFTISHLSNLIGLDGTSDISNQFLEGIIPSKIPKHPKMFLQQLSRVRKTVPLDMNEATMCTGFLK
jgi:hypothetical protein